MAVVISEKRKSKGNDDDDNNDPDWLNQIKNLNTTSPAGLTLIREEIERQNNFLEGVNDGSWVYFVHSYMIKTKETGLIAAHADYGIKVPAVIQQKNFIGTQFHPEKSGKIGSLMLSNFLSECKK